MAVLCWESMTRNDNTLNDCFGVDVSMRPLRVEELAAILAVQFDEAAHPTFNAAWRPEDAEEAWMSVCS